MLKLFRAGRASVLVWILMALLIVGLAGFGIGVGGGLTSSSVAQVGAEEISADAYARMFDQQLRAVSQQTGRAVSAEDAKAFGLDRMALLRLVDNAALDGAAARLGISAGDEAVREELLTIPAFQGPDGFNREAYLNSLNRIGMNTAEFEASVRDDITRSVLVSSLTSSARMPKAATDTLLGYVGAERRFDWIMLDEAGLSEPIPDPDDAALAAYHDAHSDRYTRPETRQVTYAIASPERLAAEIEIPEDELRAAYEAQKAEFTSPETRLLERIGFGSEAEAQAAKDRIDAGEASFDEIATERGLTQDDTDQGMVEADDLVPDARDAVFGATEPGIVGPVPSTLGPSLYRINAIFAAKTTPFEEARAELRQRQAQREASTEILNDLDRIRDLIAGGATLEEVAQDTVMQIDTVDVSAASAQPPADDGAFIAALDGARQGVETDLFELADGSYAALRLEAVQPPAIIPLDEIRDQVAADWHAEKLVEALHTQAEEIKKNIDQGETLAALAEEIDTSVHNEGPLTRNDSVDGTPSRLVADIFAAEDGDALIVDGADRVVLAQVTGIDPYDPSDLDLAAVHDSIAAQLDSQVHDDLREILTTALREEAGVRLNQSLIDQTIARFP
jgi:peptidyl-prolyl cis-trans isomerase D